MPDLPFLTELERLAKAATPGPWHAGHFADDTHSCNCTCILDEGHAGGIGEVFVGNGLPISQGGNDAPEPEEAKANLRYIAACHPQAILSLIEALRNIRSAVLSDGLAAGKAALEKAWDECPDLPPIEFAIYEADTIIRAVLTAALDKAGVK